MKSLRIKLYNSGAYNVLLLMESSKMVKLLRVKSSTAVTARSVSKRSEHSFSMQFRTQPLVLSPGNISKTSSFDGPLAALQTASKKDIRTVSAAGVRRIPYKLEHSTVCEKNGISTRTEVCLCKRRYGAPSGKRVIRERAVHDFHRKDLSFTRSRRGERFR